MEVRNEPAVVVKDEKFFFRVVKFAFAQRRKTLLNALKGGGIPAEEASRMLEASCIDGSRRGETLTLQEFANIADSWYELIH